MSIAVMNWVWQHSPTSGNQRLVLLALADACSRDDGTGCWPAVATVAAKANISPRSVRRIIGELEAAGHLKVNRGGGRNGTNGYTLVLRAPVTTIPEPVDNPGENLADPGQDVTPDISSGVTRAIAGGDTGDRGGVTRLSPDPPENHQEPPPARARAQRLRLVGGRTPGGGGEPVIPETVTPPVQEVLAALGPGWPLSLRQIDRLAPRIAAALAGGWTAAALAEHLGANTAGVRNPYAVLASRLGDLPDPSHRPSVRPGPPDRSVAEALTATCPHGAPSPAGCAFCRRGIALREPS
ncbi:helix-turn-helix domain-containing protein [Planomonospora sp. ID67723]|uniref:helix-turn-helix domain-containing protein n=1 Tax=Planomonospora sp. ID67723 TaxID=2738134 RepID=UPI0018C3B96F|nr:helix-turn-helix domain-containing protein [Planomonospora sp. ID67723]MBG0828200.1 helix-turn-helix domain-containing protein [Planomonospora sp. ID67723]